MSAFLSPLRVEEFDEIDGMWKLLEPFAYQSQLLDRTVVVPMGFITDFASVPRLPFAYMVAGNKGQRAAVIHDWLYTIGKANPGTVTRLQADQVLREAMRVSGYSAAMAAVFYAAVRIGGRSHWADENVPQIRQVDQVIEAFPALASGA